MRVWKVYYLGEELASFSAQHFPLPRVGELIVAADCVWEVDYLLHKPGEKVVVVQVKPK